MISEKLFLKALQNSAEIKALGAGKVYYEQSARDEENNYLVLGLVVNSDNLNIKVNQSFFQLDVFNEKLFRAVEIADALVTILFQSRFVVDNHYFVINRSERQKAMKLEDGTWKVPVEIKLTVKEF